jgi:hypothetical protein
MGASVAEQSVQRGLLAFPAGLRDPIGAAKAAAAAAQALAGGGGATAAVAAAGSRPASAGSSEATPTFEALARVRLSGELLRSLVDGQLLRADVALADGHPQQARLVAAAAAVCVAAQAKLAEAALAASRADGPGARTAGSFASATARDHTPFRATVLAVGTLEDEAEEQGEQLATRGGGGGGGEEEEEEKDSAVAFEATRSLAPPSFTGPGADQARAAWEAAMATSAALAREQADDADWARDEDGAEGGGLLDPERWLRLREVLATVALHQGRYGVLASQVKRPFSSCL